MSKSTMIVEPGSHEITLTRIFNAPRAKVFKIMSDPKLIPQWWGPRRLTTVVDKMDVRPGGLWRFVQHDESGSEFAFHGVYHDCIAPERMVFTFEWEGLPGHVLMETVTLEELPGGKTKLTDSSVFQTVADRDGMLQNGMEGGADESMDRVDELLAKA